MNHNEPFGDKGIQRLVERLRKRSGINFSAHTLRHAFARLMLEGGCDIYTLSKIMGHSKITTTTIYLACSNQQMSKSIEMHSLN
ncbi:site-specific integrase [Candidatus Peregrinibacteria bacterium]|nr:site-specific integrase [Candidatus Peregrinibacteria bacterium]